MGKRSPGEPVPGKKPRRPREGGGEGRGRRRPASEQEVVGVGGLGDASAAEELVAGSAAPTVPASASDAVVEQSTLVEPRVVDPDLPDLSELGAGLEEADAVAQQLTFDEQQVATAVTHYDELQQKKEPLEKVAAHRKGWIARIAARVAPETNRLSNFKQWTQDDLKRFVAARILTAEHAQYLVLYNTKIEDLSKQENFTKTEKGRATLAKLINARDSIVTVVQKRLAARQEKIPGRIASVRQEVEERYGGRVAAVEGEMKEIADNPLVAERLQQREQQRVAAEAAARQAAELARLKREADARAAVERQRKEMLERIDDALKFMEERFAAAWKRINAIVGSDVRESLVAAMGAKKKDVKDKLFEPARTALVNAAKGVGKQKLESPGDVTPWMMKTKGKGSYGDALRFLSGGEVKNIVKGLPEADQKIFQERIDSVQAEATLFNFLLNGNGPKEASPFFRVFNERPKGAGAASGSADAGTKVPAADAAAGAAEARKAFAREVKEVLDAGGFAVEASTPQGLVNGVVLVEKALGKQKPNKPQTPIYRIARIVGPLQGIQVGKTSAIDPKHNSFPNWFRMAVDKHFKEVAAKEQAEFAARVAAEEQAAAAAPAAEAVVAAAATAPEPAAAAVSEAGAPTPAAAAASAEAPAAEAAPGGVEGDSAP